MEPPTKPPDNSMSRRELLALAALAPMKTAGAALPMLQAAGSGSLLVCMHEASSDRFDFKTAMEGYAKAGVRAVEPNAAQGARVRQKEGGPATRRELLDDLGLQAVSSSNQLGLAEPGDARAESLEDLKWKVELAQAIGADRLVAPSAGAGHLHAGRLQARRRQHARGGGDRQTVRRDADAGACPHVAVCRLAADGAEARARDQSSQLSG